jgi:hypothetical protein
MEHRRHVPVDSDDLGCSRGDERSAEPLATADVEHTFSRPEGADDTIAMEVADHAGGIGVPGDAAASRAAGEGVGLGESAAGWWKADIRRP